MSKKILAFVWVSVWIIALSGAGFGLWHNHQTQQKKEKADVLASSKNNQSQKSTGSAIPLNSISQPNSSGGLSVDTNSQAAALGQVGGAQNQPTNTPNNSKSTPQALDPASFGEYEKYKNSENALFGDMQVGDGTEATANHKVAVYYKGWLTNGQLFDQSRTDKDGKLQPFIFTLGAHEVVPGWEQGIAGMKVGGTRLLIVPPSVGYGDQAQGPVPANSVMVFLVQLIAVE